MKKLKDILIRREFIDSSIVTFTNFFVGFFNFAFHIIMQRLLGPQGYGTVYPLILLSLFISLIPTTFQFIVTKNLSNYLKNEGWGMAYFYFKKSLLNIIKVLFFVIALLFLIMPVMKKAFHISSNFDFYYLIIMSSFSFITTAFFSLIQSRESFIIYSIFQILPVIVKFISGIMIVYLTKSYLGMLASFIISNIFAIGLLYTEYRLKKNNFRDVINLKLKFSNSRFFIEFLKAFPAISGFTVLSNIDALLVRVKYPELSGVYSSVSVIGKASFYIAISISTVFLPILSKSKDTKKANKLALFFLSLFLLIFILSIFILSPIISSYVLKGQYTGFEKLLPYYTLLYLPFAYITYLVNYYIISERKIYDISIVIAIVIQMVGILCFAKNIFQIINIMGLSGMVVLILLLIEELFSSRLNMCSSKN